MAKSRETRRTPRVRVTAGHLERVFELLHRSCGLDFTHYKTPTIVRRLVRRMTLTHNPDAEAYIAHLERTPEEVLNLHGDLLIQVTRFFREPQAVAVLASQTLPSFEIGPHATVRAWVAGCATGEEAYSLGILMCETFGESLAEARVQIFGTDVSESAVDYARRGLYPASIANDVSPTRLRQFFNRTDGGYVVARGLRDMCSFVRHDLTRDPPLTHLDLICCRNVLIYMDVQLQQGLMSLFHHSLKPGGVLMLGRSEGIGRGGLLFAPRDKKHRIFMSRPESNDCRSRDSRTGTEEARNEATRLVLRRYAPPSVLVDQNLDVVQLNGATGRYMDAPPNADGVNVLTIAHEGLRHGLRTALQNARETGKPCRERLYVRNGSATRGVDLEVIPIVRRDQPFYLVLFEEPKPALAHGRRKTSVRRQGAKTGRIARLEEEVTTTREYLQSTIQEIEATNEELQAANEEILTSNEELQRTNEELDSAKEELQSTNEELSILNDELMARNEELTRTNTDLLSLLETVPIAVVIVSRDLRIRRYTPIAEQVFQLLPRDIGRSFTQTGPNILSPELLPMVTEVMDTDTTIERMVWDPDGKPRSLRIRPCRDADGHVEGAVIALFEQEPVGG